MNDINGIPGPDQQQLTLWTVYDRPKDYPEHYVARLSIIGIRGVQPTQHLMLSSDLDAIRTQMMALGLHCLTRLPGDEPHIIEVWL